MGNLGKAIASRNAFVRGRPQRKTTTLRIIQGIHARNVPEGPRSGRVRWVEDTRFARSGFDVTRSSRSLGLSAPSLPLPVLTSRQILFGCQNFRNRARQPIETAEAITSTSQGP